MRRTKGSRELQWYARGDEAQQSQTMSPTVRNGLSTVSFCWCSRTTGTVCVALVFGSHLRQLSHGGRHPLKVEKSEVQGESQDISPTGAINPRGGARGGTNTVATTHCGVGCSSVRPIRDCSRATPPFSPALSAVAGRHDTHIPFSSSYTADRWGRARRPPCTSHIVAGNTSGVRIPASLRCGGV